MRNLSRPVWLAAAAAGVLVLAACGESSPSADQDGTAAPATTPTPSTAPGTTAPETTVPATTAPATVPSPTGYEHPTGADDVVIEITQTGGFVPVEVQFTQPPTLVVTGDGRVITQGVQLAIYPGPLLPALNERTITEEGIQKLLAKADELGLLADVEYGDPATMVTDMPDTVVRITTGGRTYEHSAYALGMEPETDPARARLFDFFTAAADLAGTVGARDLGPERSFESDSYLIRAIPVDLETMDLELPPTLVDWPADASVRLADAGECAELPRADGDPLFADATQLTFFTEAGVTYQVAATLRVPGRTC